MRTILLLILLFSGTLIWAAGQQQGSIGVGTIVTDEQKHEVKVVNGPNSVKVDATNTPGKPTISFERQITPGKEANASSITGTCIIKQDQDFLPPSPAKNVSIILFSEHDREINRTTTGSDGTFSFSTEPGKSYKIKTESSRYQNTQAEPYIIKTGEKVTFSFVRK